MMRLFRRFLGCWFLLALLAGSVTAQIAARQSVALFTAADPTGTESYSSTINVDGAATYKLIQINVSTLASTNVVVTIYCRVRNETAFYAAATKTITSATQEMVNVVERCYEMRVGLKTTGDAAGDSVTIRLDFQ